MSMKNMRYHAAELLREALGSGKTIDDCKALLDELLPGALAQKHERDRLAAEAEKRLQAYFKRKDDNYAKLAAAMTPQERSSWARECDCSAWNGGTESRRTVLFRAIGTLRGAQLLQDALGDSEESVF